jgi:hypothetical protein
MVLAAGFVWVIVLVWVPTMTMTTKPFPWLVSHRPTTNAQTKCSYNEWQIRKGQCSMFNGGIVH